MTEAAYAERQAKNKVELVSLADIFSTLTERPKYKVAKPKKAKPAPYPTESQEQVALIKWCDAHRVAKHIFAIPNGSNKSMASAAKFKREGLRSGVPDLFLPEPRRGYHGLFIEMKRQKGGATSQAQDDWLLYLASNRYCTMVARGADEAIERIEWYLKI